jgi:hypothetical protein
MFSDFFNPMKRRQVPSRSIDISIQLKDGGLPLKYNWVLTNKLAIGPMPRTAAHWRQLENDGFRKRFSCCYPYEHIFTPIPETWNSREVSLPDHRQQNKLDKKTLSLALTQAEEMLAYSSGALYLHCFAGQERSALIAIGLLCIVEKKDLFDSIAIVRECHKRAKPLYDQLDLLEQILKRD